MSGEPDVTDFKSWEEAFNTRDLPRLLAHFDRDAVLEEQPDFSPNPGSYEGWLEIGRYWESFDRAWEELRVEVQETRTAGNDLLFFSRFTARGRTSGAPVDAEVVIVPTVREGRVSRLRLFGSKEAALEAAGLSE